MPETIDLGPILNATSATTPKVDIHFGGVTFGRGGEIRSDVHSILPTGGAFDLPRPPPTALPEYSLENENAASDHAASAAAEIAQKIAESSRGAATDPGSRAAAGGQQATPSSFRAAALKSVTEHVEIRERRAAKTGGSAGTGASTDEAKAPAGIDATRVPNLWLAVAHSASVKAGEVKKVVVDGVPIALWRTALGAVAAQSDVCIHRGASLARGWVTNDRLVCPCEFLFCFVYWPGGGERGPLGMCVSVCVCLVS